MATIHVVLATVRARSRTGGTLPIVDSVPVGVDTFTSAANSALCPLEGAVGQIWIVTALDGPVWVKFGTGTPLAAAEDGWLIPTGQTRDFAVTTAAEKLAIKDA